MRVAIAVARLAAARSAAAGVKTAAVAVAVTVNRSHVRVVLGAPILPKDTVPKVSWDVAGQFGIRGGMCRATAR